MKFNLYVFGTDVGLNRFKSKFVETPFSYTDIIGLHKEEGMIFKDVQTPNNPEKNPVLMNLFRSNKDVFGFAVVIDLENICFELHKFNGINAVSAIVDELGLEVQAC